MSETNANPTNPTEPTTPTAPKDPRDKGLTSPQDMVPTGRKTGKIAKETFQANGKTYIKGNEVLGVSAKDLETLEAQGLV